MKGMRIAIVLSAVAALILALAPTALAAKPRVAVLPFLIHAKKDMPELSTELQTLLLPSLTSPSLTVIPATEVAAVVSRPSLDPAWAREMGARLKADWVVFGSLTKIGRRVSLDILLLETRADRPARSMYRQGRGLASLKKLAESIGREIKSKILGLKVVKEVVIEGNRRIEPEAITVQLRTRPGDYVDPDLINEDIKTVFRMGYFSDVRAYTEDEDGESKVVIQVKENPAIREIKVEGGSIKEKDVLAAFNIEPLSVYNGQTVANGMERVANLYREKGYLNVEVSEKLTDIKEGLATLVLTVNEHKKVYVEEINFTGNRKVSDKVLRKQMETTDWGILSFFTKSGILNKEVLEKDIEKIKAYYHDHGFLKAQVGEPKIKVTEEKIVITIPVDEGAQYKVSTVNFEGDLIKPAAEIKKMLKLGPGQVYSRTTLEIDRDRVAELYAAKGYAKVRVFTKPTIDAKSKTVALTYRIKKGELIYLERIVIRGNTRTRDKVIRREIMIREGDLFNLRALRRSAFNLRRLGFFEAVDFKNVPGSAPNKMILEVHVKEKQTGMFNFGVGYSSQDSLLVMANISENNLFGRGQQLSARGALGFKVTRGSVSFTEPWLFDIPLRSTITFYNVDREYSEYDKNSVGGFLTFSYPILPKHGIRGTIRYTYEEATISNIEDGASLVIQDQEGTHSTSSITATLRRDTRDAIFNTTRGSNNYVQVEYAGLGGTNKFTKYTAGSGWFFPLFWGTVFAAQGKVGYVQENAADGLPLYEKFYLGGINSLRGFEFASVGPKDPATGDTIGGEKMLQFNFEFIFPLLADMGLKGLVFFDTGNAWAESEDYSLSDLRRSAGLGVRWYSPVGPLRLEYGWILDRKEGENAGAWEFTIGSMF